MTGLLLALSLIQACWAGAATDDDLLALANRLRSVSAVRALTPAGMAALLGHEPARIYAFVREQVRFQSYRGALRGERGTLQARAGNALDQAILLKSMLDAAGQRSRIVRGVLSAEQAARLGPLGEEEASGHTAISLSEEDAAALGADPLAVRQRLAEFERAGMELVDRAALAARADAEALAAALGDLEYAEPDAADADYFWVEMRRRDEGNGGGSWIQLHPVFPEGAEVDARALGVIHHIASVPVELFHWVRLRLILEILNEDGSLGRGVVLEKRILPAAVTGRTVVLALRPRPNQRGVALDPAILAGGFVLSGSQPLELAGSDGSARPGAATALWLEVALLSPAERPRQYTITLADSLGSDKRAQIEAGGSEVEFATLADDELCLIAELATAGGGFDQAVQLELAGRLLGWVELTLKRACASPAEHLEGFPPHNPLLLSWAAQLESCMSRAAGREVYLNAPAVACALHRVERDRLGGVSVSSRAGVVLARIGGAGGDLQSGLAAGAAASRLLAELARRHTQDGEAAASALSVEADSRVSYSRLSPDTPSDALPPWPEESVEELADDLRRGSTALVPGPLPPEPLWWRLEREGSCPVARGAGGWLLAWPAAQPPASATRLLGQHFSAELMRAWPRGQSERVSQSDLAAAALRYLRRHWSRPGGNAAAALLSALPDDRFAGLLRLLATIAGDADPQ